MNELNQRLIDAAQGGAQGLEDAAALGELLPQGLSTSEINSRLNLFAEIRRQRCTAMQLYSYAAALYSPVVRDGESKFHECRFPS